MVEPHLHLATMNTDITAFGKRKELDDNFDDSNGFVEIYSDKTKTWTHQYIKTEEKSCYCVGSFMGKLYLTGGYIKRSRKRPNSCCTYDINSNTWNEITDLNVARDLAACTVFKGKIVVTGGINIWSTLKSVEAYDHHENKWTYLPDMIEERYFHSAVSMGNKMFVIAGDETTNCEVSDNYSRKFTKIFSKIKEFNSKRSYIYAFSIGNSIVVVQHFPGIFTETVVYLYDVDNDKWKNFLSDFSKNVIKSSFVKYYS